MDRAIAQDRAEGRDPLTPGSDTLYTSHLYSQMLAEGIDHDTAAALAGVAVEHAWIVEDYDAFNYL